MCETKESTLMLQVILISFAIILFLQFNELINKKDRIDNYINKYELENFKKYENMFNDMFTVIKSEMDKNIIKNMSKKYELYSEVKNCEYSHIKDNRWIYNYLKKYDNNFIITSDNGKGIELTFHNPNDGIYMIYDSCYGNIIFQMKDEF